MRQTVVLCWNGSRRRTSSVLSIGRASVSRVSIPQAVRRAPAAKTAVEPQPWGDRRAPQEGRNVAGWRWADRCGSRPLLLPRCRGRLRVREPGGGDLGRSRALARSRTLACSGCRARRGTRNPSWWCAGMALPVASCLGRLVRTLDLAEALLEKRPPSLETARLQSDIWALRARWLYQQGDGRSTVDLAMRVDGPFSACPLPSPALAQSVLAVACSSKETRRPARRATSTCRKAGTALSFPLEDSWALEW